MQLLRASRYQWRTACAARLITARALRRPMPLTAAGGANAVNAQDADAVGGGGGGGAGADAGQPAVKKAKGADKGRKRALKRL